MLEIGSQDTEVTTMAIEPRRPDLIALRHNIEIGVLPLDGDWITWILTMLEDAAILIEQNDEMIGWGDNWLAKYRGESDDD
jgi:hypothetical protein